MMRLRSLGSLVLGGLLLAAPARAEEPSAAAREEAKRRYAAGEVHFEKGSFVAALVEYEAGYRLTRLPGFLINIAQCHRLLGELKKARAHYRKYLLVLPTSPRRQEIEDLLLELDKAIAETAAAAPESVAEVRPAAPLDRSSSVRWWTWSALAASMVGSTVATSALSASESSHAKSDTGADRR